MRLKIPASRANRLLLQRCQCGWTRRVFRVGQIMAGVLLILTLIGCGGAGDDGDPPTVPESPGSAMAGDGPQMTVGQITNFNGQAASLRTPGGVVFSSVDHTYTASTAAVLHTPEYSATEWLVPTDANARHTGFIHTTWNGEKHSDYLTYGSWIDQSAANFGLPGAPIEIGALFDAPEFRHAGPISATSGQVSYRGSASVAYRNVTSPGTDHGLFVGPVRLNADFQQNRITGCIGCGGHGIVGYPAGLPDRQSFARLSSTRIHLEDGTIRNASSTYTGARIAAATVTNSTFSVREASGSWQGVVSSRGNDLGEPRAVGGTAEGQITYGNATTLQFSAAFIGGSE